MEIFAASDFSTR